MPPTRRRLFSATARLWLRLALMWTLTALGFAILAPPARADTPALLFVQHPCTPVYAGPGFQGPLLTQLLGGADVTPVASGSSSSWTHVQFWGEMDGYIQASALGAQSPEQAREGDCAFPGLPDTAPEDPSNDHGPWPITAQGVIVAKAALGAQPDPAAPSTGVLAKGATVTLTQWGVGPNGQAWYQAQGTSAAGWVWSGAVRVQSPDPTTYQKQGRPIWSTVAGKGMWFTNYLPHHADVGAMMRAAKAAGVTHVYAEVAIGPVGFYARNTLDRLIPAAHAQGIAVISWVYPYLKNVASDVRLTETVARYTTPSGDHADGIAADIEEVVDSGSVYSYGQVVRALLGPDMLMVATVFHPFARGGYPYAAIAANWNVLAPMDYWHSRAARAYTKADVTRFVSTSILTIRAAMAAAGVTSQMPIEELGQTYNMFTDDFTWGADAPTGDEITADLQTARDLGCIGASFFEWQTATQEQWRAITAFAW